MGTKDQLTKTFSENLQKQLKEHNKLQKDLIHDLNFGSGIVSEWYTGKKYPRIDKIEALANYLGIHKYQLIEDANVIRKLAPVTPNEQMPINQFTMEEKAAIYQSTKATPKTFMYVCEDNSMYPEIQENDILTIQKQKRLLPNTIMAILYQEDIIIRKVEVHDQQLQLIPMNTASFPIFTYLLEKEPAIQVLGNVIEVKRIYK